MTSTSSEERTNVRGKKAMEAFYNEFKCGWAYSFVPRIWLYLYTTYESGCRLYSDTIRSIINFFAQNGITLLKLVAFGYNGTNFSVEKEYSSLCSLKSSLVVNCIVFMLTEYYIIIPMPKGLEDERKYIWLDYFSETIGKYLESYEILAFHFIYSVLYW